MKLHLIRHSLTAANEAALYCGALDPSLSAAGVQLALCKIALGGYPDPDTVTLYTSGMKRTEETFQLLFGKRPHTVLPAFREMHFGCFEGKSYLCLKTDPVYQKWIQGNNEANVCPGGESGEQMSQRVSAAAAQLIQREEDALVLSHGGPIAALMACFFPKEGRSRYQWQPAPAEGYTIFFRNRTPEQYMHLPVVYHSGKRE